MKKQLLLTGCGMLAIMGISALARPGMPPSRMATSSRPSMCMRTRKTASRYR